MNSSNNRGGGRGGRGGRGGGGGPKSTRVTLPGKTGGGRGSRGGGGRGRGTRGRGRGLGGGANNSSATLNASLIKDQSFDNDGDDDICEQALGQYELESSEVSRALENVNVEEHYPGFEETAGSMWIYPTNRPVRDYQFQMVQTSLFNNTLVCLPTGLGKTFIAAVVMYNFHRWYPQGLIIFMAPTKPLVTQQLEACHNIVGIHPSNTVELTGQIPPKKRDELWKSKRVFFLTPQVMTSDLARGVCPLDKVRCIVADEAHKATGAHAYVQVISSLVKGGNMSFRVLALSATPGNDLAAVQQVFKNLLISKVELRSENSPDVLPYTHTREMDKVVVQLDPYLSSVYDKVMEVFHTYTGKLMKVGALYAKDCGGYMSQYQLLRARESFRQNVAPRMANYQKGYVELDFAISISLAHGIEVLSCHGLRSFYIYVQGVFNKEKATAAVSSELKKNTILQELIPEIQEKLCISSNSSFNFSTSKLFSTFSRSRDVDVSICEEENVKPETFFTSHPKMKVLRDIVMAHFKKFETRNDTTRVMIFSQYRDSVQEIGLMLSTLGSLVKPMVFVGQANTGPAGSGGGKGLKQREQVQVVEKFRNGGYNVLVSTSVGEEGLDIGEVDLIICYDSSKSPTRLVQRMGRTGRQRKGKIMFLLTAGKEERSYNAGFSLQKSISNNVTDPEKLKPFLYKHSPRMVPLGMEPQCFKMNVVLTSEQHNTPLPTICDEDFLDDEDVQQVRNIGDADDFDLDLQPSSRGKSKSTKRPRSASAGPTLTQCISNFFKKRPRTADDNDPAPAPSYTVVSDPVPIAATTSKEDEVVFIDESCQYEVNQTNDLHYDIFNEIFDVVRPSDVVAKPCLNISKPPPLLEWLPEYNEVDPTLILLTANEINLMMGKLEVSSRYREVCSCGVKKMDYGEDLFIEEMPMSNQIKEVQQTDEISEVRISYPEREKEQATEVGGGGFIVEEDPFFDDDDNWIHHIDEYPLNMKATTVPKTQSQQTSSSTKNNSKPPSSVPINTGKFVFKMKTAQPPAMLQPQVVKPSKDTAPFPVPLSPPLPPSSPKCNKSPVKLSFLSPPLPVTSKVAPLSIDSDGSSTTSNEAEFASPVWKSKLANPDKTKAQDNSSSTGSDEDFQSPVRKQKIEHSNKELEVDLGKDKQPGYAEGIDRELFKDDLLLFDESFNNGNNVDVNPAVEDETKPVPTPPARKNNNKENDFNLANLYYGTGCSTGVISPPSSPPSIFNRSKRNIEVPKDQKKSPIKTTASTSFSTDWNDDDDDLMQLDLSDIEEQALRSAGLQKENSNHGKTEYPTKNFEVFPSTGTGTGTSSSNFSLSSALSLKKKQEKEIAGYSGWIETVKSGTVTQTHKNQLSNFKRSQQLKMPVFKKPLTPSKPKTPIEMELSDDEDFEFSSDKNKKKKFNVSNSHEKPALLVGSPSPILPPTLTRRSKPLLASSPLTSGSFSRSRKDILASRRNNLNSTFLHDDQDEEEELQSSSISKRRRKKKKKPRSQNNQNPFLLLEAVSSGDEGGSSSSGEGGGEDLDTLESSFVDDSDNDDFVSASQQVRYLQSVKDLAHPPVRSQLPAQRNVEDSIVENESQDFEYESDSFCMDEVEYADVGVFTQAMNVAREEVLNEDEEFGARRITRRTKRTVEIASKAVPNDNNKKRRRIINVDSSSDED